ncbi:MazG-like family protein [Vagococcus fluvialis]|uniref:MazG-like family protein n=1 Tax=Vagococcus fluvialis TaxID=2738 RepID=UPI001D0A740A|nr:MazG-like family protein [Vagococcus fluvialis]UDM72691.1 MazG-like family protein [Vagococcus fluvialis]UDM78414.1 MazG-like family protein [Vagococcus fluvialis]UDM83966.1 MazG-like family protein [Vagococcus fluvialis]
MSKEKVKPHFISPVTNLKVGGVIQWGSDGIPIVHAQEVPTIDKYMEELEMKEQLKMKVLIKKVEEWAIEKGIHNADSRGQFLKVVEEAGEIAEGVLTIWDEGKEKEGLEMVEDAIGDTFVTIIILAQQQGLKFEELFDNAEVSEQGAGELTRLYQVIGEVSGALARDIKEGSNGGVEKPITDMIPLLTNIAAGFEMTPSQCLEVAYNVISKRKGRTVNGVFIKEEDLKDGE